MYQINHLSLETSLCLFVFFNQYNLGLLFFFLSSAPPKVLPVCPLCLSHHIKLWSLSRPGGSWARPGCWCVPLGVRTPAAGERAGKQRRPVDASLHAACCDCSSRCCRDAIRSIWAKTSSPVCEVNIDVQPLSRCPYSCANTDQSPHKLPDLQRRQMKNACWDTL